MRYAVRNLGRLKTRNFLTFATALVILFLSMFGILVGSLCTDSRERAYGPLDGTVYVTDEARAPFFSYSAALTIAERVDSITGVSAVKQYDAGLIGIDHVGVPRGFGGFRLCGVTSMDILEEVYSGELTMVEGTMITTRNNERHDNKIVISDILAEKNGLSIGDIVPLHMFTLFHDNDFVVRFFDLEDSRYTFPYIVGGIYHNVADNSDTVNEPSKINANKIYVPMTSLLDITETEAVQIHYTAPFLSAAIDDPVVIPDATYFHLSDLNAAAALQTEMNSLGFAKEIRLTKYMSDAASSPSARLSQIISVLLVGIVIAGFAIFLLVVFFNMNARHRELAVLTALGKKRSAVAASFFAEIAMLVVTALAIGSLLFTGLVSLCATPITRYLLTAEFSAKISNESADIFLIGNPAGEQVLALMADFGFLLKTYILPAVLITLAAVTVLMACVYAFVLLYVRRINALSAVGGKD